MNMEELDNQDIRTYSHRNPGQPVVIKDGGTGIMAYLIPPVRSSSSMNEETELQEIAKLVSKALTSLGRSGFGGDAAKISSGIARSARKVKTATTGSETSAGKLNLKNLPLGRIMMYPGMPGFNMAVDAGAGVGKAVTSPFRDKSRSSSMAAYMEQISKGNDK